MALLKSYYKVYRAFPDPDYFYIQNEYAESNTFTLSKNGTPASTDLSYSKDKITWTAFDLTLSTNTVPLAHGEKLYLRSSTGLNLSNNNNKFVISCSQRYSIGGCFTTLFDYLNWNSVTEIPDYALTSLFSSSLSLISASAAYFGSITSVAQRGLQDIFNGCRNLVSIPDFSNFTNIGLGGLVGCFNSCSLLTTGPDFSNITNVGQYGFSSCFYGCTLLNNVTAPNISSWTNNDFYNWLQLVSASGVVYKPAALSIPTDSVSGVPTGWTTQNY